ncbi:MAG: dUTP diphosphatase [Candidatus Promineifilaceae bacterium]
MTQSNFQKIVAFHKAAGAAYSAVPTVPNEALLDFRLKLIREEYEEVCAAAEELLAVEQANAAVDLAPLAHELADLLYVVYGTFASIGVDADAVFAEVHRANMTKIGGPVRGDGKLLKPEGWQPADVTAVLEKLMQK